MQAKRIIGILLTVFLFASIHPNSAKAEDLICEINFLVDEMSFGRENGYDTVTLPDCIFTIDPGKPRLPLKVLHFAIDRDKDISDIEIITDTTEEIQGEYNIYPAQKPTRMDQKPELTPPDKATYNSSESYPESRVEIKAKGSLSGTKLVTVHVYPLEYIPVEKKLILHTTMKFRIVQESKSTLSPQSVQLVAKRTVKSNDTIKSMLEKIVANPEYIEEQFKQPLKLQSTLENGSGAIDYLIITSEELKNSGVYQPLIDSKVARGLSVAVETVQDIETNYSGRDTAEKIRNCIKDKWANNGLVWVLLGGDTNIIPVRGIEILGFDVPCDMYYSDLDGDWDANGNDIFGEEDDNVDMYPDVFVGRAPVEDEIEAEVFVNKVLKYEANIPYYADKALFLGTEDVNDAGGRAKEFIARNYMPVEFDPITKYYQRDIPEYSRLTLDSMNEGYHLINHIDHAQPLFLATGGDYIFIDDIDDLTNISSPSILWSCGCYPAAIDYDCIAEHWVNNPNGGGVAFIGNSRAGVVPYSDQDLDPEFYKSLFVESFTHIGQTLADSKVTFIGQVWRSVYWKLSLFELNLLGDPEMNIMTDMSLLKLSLTVPLMDAFVHGILDIQGNAFTEYELYCASKTQSEDTALIISSATPVQQGSLGLWDTTQYLDGEYILTLKIVDTNLGELTRSVDVTVDNYNQPPEFINLTNKGAVIGRNLKFKVEASDPDDPKTSWGNLEYSAENLPPGAVFNPGTRIFSWSPTEEDKGVYEVIFTANDSEYTISKNIVITTVVIEETPVYTGVGEQVYPAIYEDRIVWQEGWEGTDVSIYVYDLSTNQMDMICSGCYGPDIYGDRVVWGDYRNGLMNRDIYMYDLATDEETAVCTASRRQEYPAIYEDKIVWEDWRNGNGNSDIYMYNFTTGEEDEICVASLNQKYLDIYEDRIIWKDERVNWDIYMYDLVTSEEVQIATNSIDEGYADPVICKDKVAWSDHRTKAMDIYIYDLVTREEVQITDNSANQGYPDIYEDRIVWSDYRAGDGNCDIYMYDFLTKDEIRITTHETGQGLPAIYGDKVIWTDDRNGDKDIYMARVTFAPQIVSVEISGVGCLTITGINFGYNQENSKVEIEPGIVCSVETWSNTEVRCIVPENICTGVIKVITRGGSSNGIELNFDVDADTLPDMWELENFGNLDQGSNDDPDGDGYTNLEEYIYNTDPNNAESFPIQFTDSGIDILGSRNGSIACGDYDNDGDLDLAVCGDSVEGQITKIYKNNNDGTFTDIGGDLLGVSSSFLAWGDYDNDGYLDLAVLGNSSEGSIAKIYRNNDGDTFTDIAAELLGVYGGSLAWGDYDNDGDLDLALSGGVGPDYFFKIYNNDNNTFIDIEVDLPGVVTGSLAWGDYDNDGYLDLAMCGYNRAGLESMTRVYRNNGDGTFTDIEESTEERVLSGVSYSSLAWGDYNNDGLLDLVVSGRDSNQNPITRIYKNDGDGAFYNIEANLVGVYESSLAWGDCDNDGYLDLAVCGESGPVWEPLPISRIYKNNRDDTFSDIMANLLGVSHSSLAWGDYGNDGYLDLAISGYAGPSLGKITKIYFRSDDNRDSNIPPSSPANLTHEEIEGDVVVKWDAGYDIETPEAGLYYNVGVGTIPGAEDIVSGVYGSPLLGNYLRPKLSDSQLGLRLKNLPAGIYYWSVQTIDAGLKASEWSDEETFLISPSCWDCPSQCHGDANCDGVVDTADWLAFHDAFAKNYWTYWNNGAGPYNPCADFNRDGYVDTSDWPALRDNWDKQVPSDCDLGGIWPPER